MQRQRGNSSVRSAIDRLAKILEKRNDNDPGDELPRFLSREKGFRSEQVWNSCVFHRCTPLYSPNFVSTNLTCRYFTIWREESLRRRRKPMIGSALRLCRRIKALKKKQDLYDFTFWIGKLTN